MRPGAVEAEMRVAPHRAQREGLALVTGNLELRRLLAVGGEIQRDEGIAAVLGDRAGSRHRRAA